MIPRICLRCQNGLTLLEVVIAMLIIAIGLLAAARMQIVSRYGIGKAHQGILNSVSAAGQLESLLATAYDDPLLSDPDDGYHPENADHGPYEIAPNQSRIEWEVDDDYPAANTKRITVIIRYADRGGQPRIFSYDYIKSRDYI